MRELTTIRRVAPQPLCDGHSACCLGVALNDRVCISQRGNVPEHIRREVLNEPATKLWIHSH